MKVKEESEKVGLKLSIWKTKVLASNPITSWQIDWETMETVRDFIFGGSKITADGDGSHVMKRHVLLRRKAMTNLYSILKSWNSFLTKVYLVKAIVSPVVMYGYEIWILEKAESRRTMPLNYGVEEDSWESRGLQEIKPFNPEGNQSWTFIGSTDAEVETATLWSPDVKKWPIGKDPNAGKDWRREGTGMTEGEIVGWHHQLNEHEFEQAPGVGDGQGSLVCCSPWGHKEKDWVTELNWIYVFTLLSPYLPPSPLPFPSRVLF